MSRLSRVKVKAGDLPHRVEIQSFTETRDAYGGVTKTPVTDATVWARVSPLSGREYWQAAQVQSETTHEIEIRYRTRPEAKQRVLWGSRVFEILSVINPEERNVKLLLMCKETGV